MIMQTLRDAILQRPVLGTFIKVPRSETIEIVAFAGFDFAICDWEHGQMDERLVQEMIIAGRAAGVPVVVRIATCDRGAINRLLEAGAAGVQLSRTDVVSAATLRSAMRYPPVGTRSVSLTQPSAHYGAIGLSAHLTAGNDALIVGQVETRGYHEQLQTTVELLDVVFIGPVDLSVDLGHPGDLDAPPVAAAISAIEEVGRRVGAALGTFCADAAAAAKAVAAGYRYIAISGDVTMLRRGAEETLGEVRAALDSTTTDEVA